MIHLHGLVMMQNISTQKMSNLRGYSTVERESKIINVNVCSTEESESNIIHDMDISVNTNTVKDKSTKNLCLRIIQQLK